MTLEDALRTDTVLAARLLLGCRLIHETEEGTTSAVIVETEAYTADDPASHSFRGPTPRNAAMFGRAGTAYVYRIHQQACLNVVTRGEGVGEAVLIRALKPLSGVEVMRRRRGEIIDRLLCAGPGRLCSAMGVTTAEDGAALAGGNLRLEAGEAVADELVVRATRIGISRAAERPWRFYLRDCPFVSKRDRAAEGQASPRMPPDSSPPI